jgi:hypothetical protein
MSPRECLADTSCMSHEVFRKVGFPFDGGRFPDDLDAVIQRTVLDGQEPARVVIHDVDGDWLVGDGVNDPNASGASVVAVISHVAVADATVAELASLPVGWVAERDDPGFAWSISEHVWPDEP